MRALTRVVPVSHQRSHGTRNHRTRRRSTGGVRLLLVHAAARTRRSQRRLDHPVVRLRDFAEGELRVVDTGGEGKQQVAHERLLRERFGSAVTGVWADVSSRASGTVTFSLSSSGNTLIHEARPEAFSL